MPAIYPAPRALMVPRGCPTGKTLTDWPGLTGALSWREASGMPADQRTRPADIDASTIRSAAITGAFASRKGTLRGQPAATSGPANRL